MVASYRRRRLWGITEGGVDAFDALVAAAMSPGTAAESDQRRLLMLVLDGLVGAGNGGGRALIEASPMRSGFPTAAAARAWIVDLLVAAAHGQAEGRCPECDDDGEPAIHGKPFKRLRNRSGLARLLLDRRIELMLSQEVVADACAVVQGEVQAWEAGTRIPTSVELDVLAHVLDLDRGALADAETGSAVFRNDLSAERQAELDALFWESDVKVPDLAARFGLQGRSLHKLVTPVRAGVECEDCGAEMIFTARGRRRVRFATCPTCRRGRYLDRHPSGSTSSGPNELGTPGSPTCPSR